MNNTYDIADAVNPNEEIYSKPAEQDTAKDKHGKDSPLDIVATQYADLLWELYWYKKRAEREKAANSDNDRRN